jgi:hypothetical protein
MYRPVSAARRWFRGLAAVEQANVGAFCKEVREDPCRQILADMMPRRARMPSDIAGGPKIGEVDAEDDTTPTINQQVEVAVAGDTEDYRSPAEKHLPAMNSAQHQSATAYCLEVAGMPAPSCETPLVVAFESQPIEFTAATGRESFAFVPGEPMSSDWPTASTPWIARDLDGDGAITSGAELFGSSTVLAGGGTARNGFAALAALDANGDGAIDKRDPAFAELVLWSDRNGDHRSSADELRPLSSVVTSIPLAYTLDPRCTDRGACEGERGTLRWKDTTGAERTGAVVDVYLPRR